jgi:glucosamine kinase
MSRTVIGVDGGGTRTRAVLLGSDGEELGRTEGWAAVADVHDPAIPAGSVAEVCAAVAQVAGLSLPADVVWAGLSGAGREEARLAVEVEMSRMGIARNVHVGTDAQAAFHDAFGDGPGVLLMSGTGSIAWGRAEDGREGRVGGWGRHLGDEGSGYEVGLKALRSVVRCHDGRAPETTLRERVLERLGLDGVGELVGWESQASRAEVAEFTPLVAKAASDGDAVSRQILVHALEELEKHLRAILTNLGPWSEPAGLALGGGLLGPGGTLRKPVEARLPRHHVQLIDRELDPALGAARLALAAPD